MLVYKQASPLYKQANLFTNRTILYIGQPTFKVLLAPSLYSNSITITTCNLVVLVFFLLPLNFFEEPILNNFNTTIFALLLAMSASNRSTAVHLIHALSTTGLTPELESCFSIDTQRDFQNYLTDTNDKNDSSFTLSKRESYRNWLLFPDSKIAGEKGLFPRK